jgi:hypothetical protein
MIDLKELLNSCFGNKVLYEPTRVESRFAFLKADSHHVEHLTLLPLAIKVVDDGLESLRLEAVQND